MKKILNMGLDVGSTTVKIAVMNTQNEILFSDYQRHFSNTKQTIITLLEKVINKFSNYDFKI
ncbi:MAG: hypothetical protein RSB84_07330, partial [Erysipelotrichaceae bacterium]